MLSLTKDDADGELWPLWPWKIGQIKSLEEMWCLLARSTSHKNLSKIRAVLRQLLHFFYFYITTPGDQTRNHMPPQFSPWVEVTEGDICMASQSGIYSRLRKCIQNSGNLFKTSQMFSRSRNMYSKLTIRSTFNENNGENNYKTLFILEHIKSCMYVFFYLA